MKGKGKEMKKNMIRRLGVVLVIVAILAMCLTGCGGSGQKGAIKDAAEGLMSALQAGDLDKITEFASEDIVKEDGDLSFVESIQGFTEEMLKSLGVEEENTSEEAMAAIEDFRDTMLGELVKSYEIGEIQIEDGIGYVSCDFTYGYDPDSLNESDLSASVQDIATSYTQENLDKLIEIYNTQGQDALTQAIVNGILPDLLGGMKEYIMSSGEKDVTCILKIENIEDKWLVTEAKLTE